MPTRAAERAEAMRIRARFEAAGAVPVEAPILLPAGDLLDLYGEDIRARAYVTSDALRGEQMLRPDFTLPVVQMHMAHGAEPARYTYAGEVFRRQEDDARRPNEYLQVGFELFARDDPAAADAEVFALIAEVLEGLPLRAATGDIGLITAAVAGLSTTQRRKAALMRHIWRPRRFRALIERFSGRAPVPESRAALLAAADPLAGAGPEIGRRGRDEIAARIAALRADAETPPIAEREVALMDALLRVRATYPDALAQLRDLAADMPAIATAVDRLDARGTALAARGIDVDGLGFEASFGRSRMEYYDGFVFGFAATDRPDLPPVATGGRYDALTRRLGGGQGRGLGGKQGRDSANAPEIRAVGGVVRPALMLELAGAEGGA